MSDVTHILQSIDAGDPNAAKELLPLVYEELRRLAAQNMALEEPGQTLQATALVHEAYLRLVGSDNQPGWKSRAHFFSAAAQAMRRILINRARDKARLKRGGDRQRIDINQIEIVDEAPPEFVIALDEALDSLENRDKLSADLIKLRFFAGLTLQEAAQSLGIPRRSADRYWSFARAWLYNELQPETGKTNP